MHCARMRNEVESCPRVTSKEFVRQQITLEPIAAAAGEDDVPGHVRAAVRQRIHVIERGEVELQGRGAVHAAAAAVAHRGSLDRPLLMSGGDLFGPA